MLNLSFYAYITLNFLLLLLISNGLTLKTSSTVLFSRLGIIIIFFNLMFCLASLYVTYIQKGIKLFAGLFNVTCVTHSLEIFILLVCIIILKLTGFYPRKIIKKYYRGIIEILKKKKTICKNN